MSKAILAKVDIWEGDLLGRERDANFLINFLTRRVNEREQEGSARSYVLNLNSQWGRGKTFFLDRLQLQLKNQGYLVASVNAWTDDHADDPLIAVMSAIDQTITPLLKEKPKLEKAWENTKKYGLNIAVATIKSSATHFTKKLVGDVFEAASEAIEEDTSNVEAVVSKVVAVEIKKLFNRQGDELLDKFNRGKAAIESFRKNLREVLPQIAPEEGDLNLPLFVLVDELDRCRPTYAISLLERVKHLFEVDNVIFIIATNSDQLKHSIKAIYGMDFDASGYLLRFFDRTYMFEEPRLEDFVKNLFILHDLNDAILSSPPEVSHQDFFIKIMQAFNLSLRDAEQCFDILRSIVTVWNHKIKIELLYLLPLIAAYLKGGDDLMKDLISGNDTDFKQINKVTIAFFKLTGNGHQPLKKEYHLWEVINHLNSELNVSLDKFASKGTRTSAGDIRWIYSRFVQEFSLLHGNSWNSQNPPYSVMQRYPEYVRSAGRLLIDDGTDQKED